ncbi:MAG: (E)-4-hydroxy-3-methylbut-2-enyl-diphosphate synthase [Paludibacteraceae bacterium]|nr:(E)-4-hydroxy-3-methylbut-2-enyl-diphosphate synthase [Paludibacteraceae bacterium]
MLSLPLTYHRRQTVAVSVGSTTIGSAYPIRVQTMANRSTDNIEECLRQTERCIEAGAKLMRFTTQGVREVESLRSIKNGLKELCTSRSLPMIPLVADVHFRSDVADEAVKVADKVRINPGNYSADASLIKPKFEHLLHLCKEYHTALRIGVNHGSLSPRMMQQFGDTPLGMVESCMEFLRIAVDNDFKDIVLSIKSSNTRVMVETVRLLVSTMDSEGMSFPLHLGVTEAGEGEDGRIKSAVGIGALLADGIGDTIRVSLSEEPEKELPVARELIDYFTNSQSVRYTGTAVAIDEENSTVVYDSNECDWDKFCLYAAADCGRLLWDNGCTTLLLRNPHFEVQALERLAKDILQASRVKIYRTELTSCPGCGRTMFDLQQTVADIKKAFAVYEKEHPEQQPLKIAVMGCIVNGPGEMADADYGYVGAGRERVSLYKGKECIMKNIPQTDAVEQMLMLVKNSQL